MLFFYFWGAIFYLETIFRTLCTAKFMGIGLIYSLIFSAPIALVLYLLCSFVKPEKRRKLAITFSILLTVIFVSQFIYYKIFRVFYSIYSVGKGGQILEFWQLIAMKIKSNFFGVCLYFVPLIVILLFNKHIKSKHLFTRKQQISLFGGIVCAHLVAIISLSFAGKASYSPFDLYFKHHYPIVAAEKIGLLTTLQLDAKRTLFNSSQELSHSIQDVTVIDNGTDEEAYEAGDEAQTEEVGNPNATKGYNVLDIDFDRLIAEDSSDELKEMDEYFKDIKPTAKNAYTGKYKGYNLIQITAESFSPYAIDEKLTPTLYKLAHEGYQFTNFYTPLWEVSTSDGEYSIMMSQIPKSGIWSMKESSSHAEPFSLGNQLKAQGYKTMAFHNHTYDFYDRQLSHPNLGYNYQAKGLGLNVTNTWPESDVEMMDLTADRYVEDEPFHIYYMTVSGHMQYSFSENAMSIKNKALVDNLAMSEDVKAYLASQIELDRAVEKLIKQLDTAGVLEHTLIALTPDHYPYGLNNQYISELAGETVDEEFDLYRSTFLLWTPHMTPKVIDKPCSSLDILPTLSNLMGLDYDSRLFVGRDIFSDAEPLVILYSHNFITGKGKYNAMTKQFMENVNADVSEAYVNQMINEVEDKFYYSAKILDENYYAHILEGMK